MKQHSRRTFLSRVIKAIPLLMFTNIRKSWGHMIPFAFWKQEQKYPDLYRWGFSFKMLGGTSPAIQPSTNNHWGSGSYAQGDIHALAILSDGSLWAWGQNENGEFGNGNVTNNPSPTQVGSLKDWKQVAAGTDYSLAIKQNGTLWAWGKNDKGQLGLGDLVSRSSPVQVGTLTNWLSVTSGVDSNFAIKTDGTLWSWGENLYGQLGIGLQGLSNNRSSPTQVGTLTNWKEVSMTTNTAYAIKTDGTLWAWGYGSQGALGNNSTVNRSSPIQVGTLTDWSKITGSSNAFALKTDGTLWTWGSNFSGQLGLGDTIHRSSPVQVGSLTTWRDIFAGRDKCFAIKNDGTLWAWGSNFSGSLGIGDSDSNAHRSSPIQVGSLTTWKSVAGHPSGNHLLGKTTGMENK